MSAPVRGSTPLNSPIAPLEAVRVAIERLSGSSRSAPVNRTPSVDNAEGSMKGQLDSAFSPLLPQCNACSATFSTLKTPPQLLVCGHTLCLECVKLCSHEGQVTCPPPSRGCGLPTPAEAVRINYAIDEVICPFAVSSPNPPPTDAYHMMLELASEMHLMCNICWEAFSDDRLPFALPCGHTFCHQCLTHLRGNDTYFKCPNRCQQPQADAKPEMLVPVLNHSILHAVNGLRAMHGLPLAEPSQASALLQPVSPPATGESAGDAHLDVPPVQPRPTGNAVRRSSQPRWFLVVMLLYVLLAASTAAVIALTQGPECYKLRRWLAGLAAIFIAVPTSTVMIQRFPNRGWKFIRVILGMLFYFWILSGIPLVWMDDDETCPCYSVPWMTSTVLMCIHIGCALLQIGRETLIFMGACRRGDYFKWIPQLAPFMELL